MKNVFQKSFDSNFKRFCNFEFMRFTRFCALYSLLCTPGRGCLVRCCGIDCGVCELVTVKSTKISF